MSRHQKSAACATATAALFAAAAPRPTTAETYLTESQALSAILGENAIPRREDRILDPALRAKLEHDTNVKFPEATYTFFISGQPGQPQKFAIVMNEIGKSEPITFMVGINDQGKVTEVLIMVFRENRGWEVKEKRFLNQFKNKTVHSPIRVEEDIINYTGATLSSKAVARGVKRALALVDAFYLGEGRHAAAARAATSFAKPQPIQPLISVSTSDGPTALFRQARYAMGTLCEIRLWYGSAGEAQTAFRSAFAEIDRFEQIFSAYREDSELSHVNREAARHSVPVSADFFNLTRFAVHSWQESAGVSDITVGPLLNAWGFRADRPSQPTDAQLLDARALVGCDKLHLEPRSRSIRFQRPAMQIDFGGLAKGYAAQRVAGLLHSRGVHAALVNLGQSSLSASALNHSDPENRIAKETGVAFGQWLVGIAAPVASHACPGYIFLRPSENLSTSGTGECQFQLPNSGRTFSHLLDPRTGIPVEGLRSVTAIASSGARSEVLAKQLLIDPTSSASLLADRAGNSEEWLSIDQHAEGDLNLAVHLLRDHLTHRT
jgi:FAD:protein FMN transferase